MQACNARGRVRKKSPKVEGTAELVTSGPEFDAIRTKVREKYRLMLPPFRFLSASRRIGKGPFPYGDVGVIATLTGQPEGPEAVKGV